MQIVAWSDWLDRHIPYYERNKQIQQYADNPPQSILILGPADRYKGPGNLRPHLNWETMDNRIRELSYKSEPVFLDNDTHQCWYWAFWHQNEALATMLKLS